MSTCAPSEHVHTGLAVGAVVTGREAAHGAGGKSPVINVDECQIVAAYNIKTTRDGNKTLFNLSEWVPSVVIASDSPAAVSWCNGRWGCGY